MNFYLIILFSLPLILASIGETVGQKSGVMNIGLEGVMLLAAFCCFVFLNLGVHPYIALILSTLIGGMINFIQSIFVIYKQANQVAVGTAINLFALGLTSALFREFYGQTGELITVPKLPAIIGKCDLVLILTLPILLMTSVFIFRTRRGLLLRATGESPEVVRSLYKSPERQQLIGLLFSGVLGGLAGGYLVAGVVGTFAENMTAGKGFIALAMVTFGRWHPVGATLSSLFIGSLGALQYSFQSMNTHVPYQIFLALPYVCSLLVLVFSGKAYSGPKSLGNPLE